MVVIYTVRAKNIAKKYDDDDEEKVEGRRRTYPTRKPKTHKNIIFYHWSAQSEEQEG